MNPTATETDETTGPPEPPVAGPLPSDFQNPLGWEPPSKETFSFDAYLQGNSTFPSFDHTVYLDQARGHALQGAIEKYDELAALRRAKLEEQEAPRSRSASLVNEFAENVSRDIEDIEEEMTALGAEMKTLETEIKKTSMTLTFQLSNIDKLTSVTRTAERAFYKKHGKGNGDDDFSHMSLRARYVLLAQLDEFCTHVVSAQGNPITKPDQAGFSALLDRLVPSESVRLLVALNKGLDSSTSWAARIDAGFPVGGPDLA